jgi:CO/xanthine dehydrogenase Mo-binding subunit
MYIRMARCWARYWCNQAEPRATMAVRDTDGTLTLYETTQHICAPRTSISPRCGLASAGLIGSLEVDLI